MVLEILFEHIIPYGNPINDIRDPITKIFPKYVFRNKIFSNPITAK